MNNDELQLEEEKQEVIEEDNNSSDENIVQTPSSIKESEILSSTTCVIALCKIGSKEPTMSTPVLSIITTS